jgi:hypothetical protein
MIKNFWNKAQSDDPDDSCDFCLSAKVDERIASADAWRRESSANPLFPLKLPWLESNNTVESATLDSLHKFTGVETGQNRIQHVKQLAEIVKDLPVV